MDSPTTSIVGFVRSTDFASLSVQQVHAVVRNYLDSVSCAAAGYDGEPVVIARALAATTKGSPAASTYGLAQPALIEQAVFANTLAGRYADYNDGGVGAGHPSDMTHALAAMAETSGSSGAELVCAIYISYEAAAAVGAVVPLRDRAWDQGLLYLVGIPAGGGKLLRLREEQLANALALSITPSIPLRVARAGELSHWKAGAGAHATMTATFATRLAQAGMTGPRRVFDGIEGLFEKVTGPFELGRIGPKEGRQSVGQVGPQQGVQSVPERVQHKYYPAEMNAQAPVHIMLKLRREFGPADVESIKLSTFHLAWHEAGGGQGDAAEKWDPQTRETADHSIPYYIAVALTDGAVTTDSFLPERVKDPALRPLMRKISVVEDEEYTARLASHGEQTAVIEVKLTDGRTFREEERFPRGHPKNPMTDDDLNDKFDRTVEKLLSPADHAELRKRLWNLPDEKDLKAITALYRKWSPRGKH